MKKIWAGIIGNWGVRVHDPVFQGRFHVLNLFQMLNQQSPSNYVYAYWLKTTIKLEEQIQFKPFFPAQGFIDIYLAIII